MPTAIRIEQQRGLSLLLDEDRMSLTECELLEALLSLRIRRTNCGRLAARLIAQYGNFAGVLAANRLELVVAGLSDSSLGALQLVQAAALQMIKGKVINRPVLDNWDRLMAYLVALLARERIERLRGLFLDTSNRLLLDEQLAHGTIDHTPVYPREVIRRAIEVDAAAMILVHNHPSGDPTPSEQDIAMAIELKNAFNSVAIKLLDCVIIGNGTWTSMRREGLI